MFNLEELYCCVDDFCQKFIPLWHQQLIENGLLKRRREASLSESIKKSGALELFSGKMGNSTGLLPIIGP